MKRPHILYITYGNMLRSTGFSEQCRAEVRQLAARRYKVTALAFENHAEIRQRAAGRRELSELYRDAGARLITVPIFGETRLKFWPVRATLDGATIAMLTQTLRVDILHAHEIRIGSVATRVGRLLKRPVIVDMHGVPLAERVYDGGVTTGDETYAWLARSEREAITHADHVFVVSHPFVEHIRSTYGIDAARISVTRSSVDTDVFRFDEQARIARRREIGVSSQPLVLFVGSVHRYQIFDQVVAFFKTLRTQRPDAVLLVLTGGVETIVAELARLGVSDGCVVRSVPHDQVAEWMSAADMGVLLRERSLVNRVASPVKAAEYLACGLPMVISDDIGDLSALVRKRDLGVVLGGLSESDYAQAARHLLKDWPQNAEAMRTRCRKAALENLSWDVCMDEFERSYEKLLTR
jgi:glycosyltransferase involved in cell wall biosynthesis